MYLHHLMMFHGFYAKSHLFQVDMVEAGADLELVEDSGAVEPGRASVRTLICSLALCPVYIIII